MRLYYLTRDGEQRSIELSGKPITIGRSGDADILVKDEKASRVHCGIRFWDGAYYVKDLKSKNGTFVNDEKVETQQLEPGDRIRIGESVFVFEQEVTPAGANTALLEMQDAYDGGKGYSTILREIIDQTGSPAHTSPRGRQPAAVPEKAEEATDDGVGPGPGTKEE
jgi:pSer/pThr/pTyr-binding forkhead associated (FHA) protein